MLINNTSKIAAYLKQQFEGSTAQYLPNYPRVAILTNMREALRKKVRVLNGPYYWGEAEQLIFMPLYQTLKAKDELPNPQFQAYRLAANYSVICEVLSVANSKEVTNSIANAATLSRDIIATYLSARRGRSEALGSDPASSFDAAGGRATAVENDITTQLRVVFTKLTEWLSGHDDKLNGQKAFSDLTALWNLANNDPANDVVGDDVNKAIWTSLVANFNKGKGYPLSSTNASHNVFYLNQILMCIDDWISKIQSEQSEGLGSSPLFVRTYTALYWLLRYFQILEDYDARFPARVLMAQSQAYVLGLKTQAMTLRDFFMDIATSCIYVDVQIAANLYKEVKHFYEPILNEEKPSLMHDLDFLWSKDEDELKAQAPSYPIEAANMAITRLKTFVKADAILPVDIYDMLNANLKDLSKPGDPATGYAAMDLPDHSTPKHIDFMSRAQIVSVLSDMATAVEAILSYLTKLKNLMRMTDVVSTAGAVANPLSWETQFPDPGQVTDFDTNAFGLHDPLKLKYNKYSVELDGTGSAPIKVEWAFTKKLMQPFYQIQTLVDMEKQLTDTDMIDTVYWNSGNTVPSGDPLTAPYHNQPIFANFTATRNRQVTPNTIQSYLDVMSGRYGIADNAQTYFVQIAKVMALDVTRTADQRYCRAMADALIPVFSVAFATKADYSDLTMIQPTLPVVHGIPLKVWNSINFDRVKNDVAAKAKINVAEDNVQNIVNPYYVFVTVENPTSSNDVDRLYFAFVLHKNILRYSDPFAHVIVPFAKKSYVQIPVVPVALTTNVLRSFGLERMSAEGVEGEGILKIAEMNNSPSYSKAISALQSAEWEYQDTTTKKSPHAYKDGDVKPIFGLAPFVMSLPHVTLDCAVRDELVQDDSFMTYASVELKRKYESATKILSVCKFANLPIAMLTVEDRANALAGSDPSPVNSLHVSEDMPDEGPKQPDPLRSEGAEQQAPDKMKPDAVGDAPGVHDVKDAANRDAAATVTAAQAVIAHENEQSDSSIKKQLGATTIESPGQAGTTIVPKALANDPSTKQNGSATETEVAEGEQQHTKAFWKRLASDGSVEDVTQAVECPDGYVPASQADYENFIKKSDNESK